jgi:hypothetical protein
MGRAWWGFKGRRRESSKLLMTLRLASSGSLERIHVREI